jgi:photosystem II stability/assembly factor-like uncharacterized protein
MRRTRNAVFVASFTMAAVFFSAPARAAESWSRASSPSPGRASILGAVSCPTESTCTAVGSYYNERDQLRTLIASTTDGTSWTRGGSLNPGRSSNELTAVSCVSAEACTAVGYYAASQTEDGPDARPLVMRTTDGSTWRRVPLPDLGRASLSGVSCTATSRCTAVGTRGTGTLVLRTSNGATWTPHSSPSPGRHRSSLSSVSCVRANKCTAVGAYTHGAVDPTRALIVRTIDGVKWSRVRGPAPPYSSLQAIDCPNLTNCSAVGNVNEPVVGGGLRGVVLRTTDGLSWTRSATPFGARYVTLTGISCRRPSKCTAVGGEQESGPNSSTARIIRSSDGVGWSELNIPNPEARTPRAVDCPSAESCTVVGFRALEEFVVRTLVLREA